MQKVEGYIDDRYERDVSLYLHIPFCEKRCLYCDFVTEAGKKQLIPAYLDALAREIDATAKGFSPVSTVHTIYLGGGTPSLIPEQNVVGMLQRIHSKFPVCEGAEVTLEMNPGTSNPAYLEKLKEGGVNRLSLGLQSALDLELRTLGRIHNFTQFQLTFSAAKNAGFENISVDLIYGIPGQSLKTWGKTLKKVLDLNPEHLSLYSLNIEEGTPFSRMIENGEMAMPDADLMADMYESASDLLAGNGFRQYEISNWARVAPNGLNFSSRHNLQYWRNLPYIGFGVGAHGSARGMRMANTSRIEEYIQMAAGEQTAPYPRSFATMEWQPIVKYERMQETMMLGLRLTEEGVSEIEFTQRYGESPRRVFRKQLDELEKEGLLESLGDKRNTTRLTRRGRLLGNRVFMEFVGD